MKTITNVLSSKRILFSGLVIIAVAAGVIASTGAYFSDTEASTGNIFTAGSIDLKVDHKMATYDGEPCVGNCEETGDSLIVNGGFETPDVPNGGYAIYPNATLTSWTVESGDGLEIQDNAVGAPHGGNQLAELDSTDSTSISQTIATVPGGKYRLHFWYSPRPNNPAGDNAIGMSVKVVSDNSVIISDTVDTGAGSGNTVWTEHVYIFTAVDTSTKIVFSDAGSLSNSYGGYLDDVSVFTLNCTSTGFPNGGVCQLWDEKDLGASDQFWNFPDIKPGDWGTNLISLHVTSNDAFTCLLPTNVTNDENGVVDPEIDANDSATSTVGELSGEIKFFGWKDDGDGIYQAGEDVLIPAGTSLDDIQSQMIAMPLTTTQTGYVGLAWCAGNQTGPLFTGDGTIISCDGSGMSNIAQTDSAMANLVAYAVQQRNNGQFSCANVNLQTPVQPPIPL